MLRKSLLAIVASFVTLSSFGGTVAIMNGGPSAAAPMAASQVA
jgi:hypothetical protein